jgi:hypothetical protein
MEHTAVQPQQIPPQAIIMQMAMGGWVARTMAEIIRLEIPDALKKSGPMTAAALVEEGIQVNAPALQRVMRACTSLGLFTEDNQGRFGLTELSEVLTSDSSASVKLLAREMGSTWMGILLELGAVIRTGEPQAHKIYGTGWWDYLKANPKEMETFGETMKSNSVNSLRGVLHHCDFSAVRKLVDIGGGFGHLVAALLEKWPHLHGVLLDMPDLIPVAMRSFPLADAGVASRLEYVGGDMFSGVPRADAYVLKHIIHDWDDEHCQRLLSNCFSSMDGAGRLICVDSVLPPLGDTSATPAKFLDLMMMALIRGKERTLQQWEELYRSAGFRVISVTPLHDNFGTSIVEGAKA